MSRVPKVAACAVIAALLSPVSKGQETTFEIHGAVVGRDQALPDIDVSLRARGAGEGRKTVTDQSGAFSFAGLSQGLYDLSVGDVPIVVPSPPYLQVDLNVDRSLTLLLPMDPDFCTQMPGVVHYLRQTGEKDWAAIRGSVRGKTGAPIAGAYVALYIPKLGRIAALRTSHEGSFSFARLKVNDNYWVRILSEGYFPGEITRLRVLPGYESIYDNLRPEACRPGHCDPSIRKLPIGPGCE